MIRKFVIVTGMTIASSLAIADQDPQKFVIDYSLIDGTPPTTPQTFTAIDRDTEFTFSTCLTRTATHTYGSVYERDENQPCDNLTVDCNNHISVIGPGQTSNCKLSAGQTGRYYDANFENGIEGELITKYEE
jgi:hypothetical protein